MYQILFSPLYGNREIADDWAVAEEFRYSDDACDWVVCAMKADLANGEEYAYRIVRQE